jgi:ATP-dependent exoDNAse (exonuclease V) beta subunit
MKNYNFDFEKLKVDKEDETVKYNDEVHKYWTKDKNLACVSVTTLIHQFTTFDEDFWSSYKALESLISEDDFKTIKKELYTKKQFSSKHYEQFGISEEQFKIAKQTILKEWEEKRETSCVRGTAIHREQELAHLAGNTKELTELNLDRASFKTDVSNKIKAGEKGVYPELLMSRISPDGKLRLAGQADLVIIDGFDVYILDYKTNKKIDKKSFYDRSKRRSARMKYPLNNLDDVNFWHYTLQLSTYA